jgi:hypothetical protein
VENLFVAFLGVVAFNIAASLVSFAVAFTTRRKTYPISWLRAGVVLISGWTLGSIIVFAVHVLSALGGLIIEDKAPLETIVSLCVLLPTMFLLLDFSRPKVPERASAQEQEQPSQN